MKNILLLFFLFHYFSTTAHPNSNPTSPPACDINGAHIKNYLIESSIPYSQPSMVSTNHYDSVRTLAEVNTPGEADAFPWISGDGLRLYYTSGDGGNHLMSAERMNSASYFSAPVAVSLNFILPDVPTTFFLTNDELDLFMCADTAVYFAQRITVADTFNSVVHITFNGITIPGITFADPRCASLTPLKDQLFVHCSSGILQFARASFNSFDYVRPLSVPAGYIPQPGQLSKDGLTYFFGAISGTNNTEIFQETRASLADSFDVSTFEPVMGINDTLMFNTQPSMSDSLASVAFVRADANLWSENDLFITDKGVINSVFDPSEIDPLVFPNPSTGIFDIKNITNAVEVYNKYGQIIFKKEKNSSGNIIDLSSRAKGIYFMKIISGEKTATVKKLIVQ